MSTHPLRPIRPLARVLTLAAPALVLLAAPPGPAAAQQEGAPTASAAAETTPAVLHACYVPATGTVYRIKAPGLSQECTGPRNGPNQHVEFSWTVGVPDHLHANLNGLDGDDHPQYLLADGSRALTGDLSADGHTLGGLGAASAPGEAVRFEQAVKSGDGAGGDLDGSYPNPTVQAIQGQPVSDATPTATGQVLTWDGAQWQGTTIATGFDLSELLAVDGAGSGVDADLLDGLDGSAFAGASHDHAQYLERAGGTMTGVLSMNGHEITGLAPGTSPGEAVPFEQAVKSGDAAGGDLAGSYPAPTVAGLRGNPVGSDAPGSGDVLTWDGSEWSPAAPSGGGVTDHGALTGLGDDDHPQYLRQAGDVLTGDLSAGGHRVTNLAPGTDAGDAVRQDQVVLDGDAAGGDLAGLYPNPTLTGIQGQPLAASSPAAGEVLTYDGSQWEPQAPPAGGIQGIERVRVRFVVPAENTINGIVGCPDGKVVLGGGFGSIGSGIEIFGSFPDHALTNWTVRFRNTGTFDETVLVYATCANGST